MYYTLILWFEIEVKPKYYGFTEIINYADYMVICFQYENVEKAIYKLIKDRLKVCGLEFVEDKSYSSIVAPRRENFIKAIENNIKLC